MGLPDTLPCICTNPNCGYQFIARNPVGGGGSNITFVGNMTNCPRCGQMARYADWSTDSQGNFHLHSFFSFIRQINNPETLKNIKIELEAANDKITAAELADTLVEIDSSFSKFRELIKSIPASAVKDLIQTLIMLLTLVVTYQTLVTSNEEHRETTTLLEQQQELDREKFEYQQRRDTLEDIEKKQAESERKKLERKIQELESSFEKRLKALENANKIPIRPTRQNTAENKIPVKPSKKLKGCDRNKPCPCGSGKKAKKCHPDGI